MPVEKVRGGHVARRRCSRNPVHSQPLSVVVKKCAMVPGKASKSSTFRCLAAAHSGQDRRFPGVATHPRPWRVALLTLDPGWRRGSPRVRYQLGHQLVVLSLNKRTRGETPRCTVSRAPQSSSSCLVRA